MGDSDQRRLVGNQAIGGPREQTTSAEPPKRDLSGASLHSR